VTGAGNRHGRREGKDALRQRRTEVQESEDILARTAERLQVETRTEAAQPPFQEDRCLVPFGLVERLVERLQHWDREHVDLAVVHGDGADQVRAGVGDGVRHDRS